MRIFNGVVKTLLAVVAVLGGGGGLVGCGDGGDNPTGSSGGNSSYGVFTVTDIPYKYNGKYAYFQAFAPYDNITDGMLTGDKWYSTGVYTAVQINNGQVKIPVYFLVSSERYTGNDILTGIQVVILNTETLTTPSMMDILLNSPKIFFGEVHFSKGSATVSANNGVLIENGISDTASGLLSKLRYATIQ